MALSGRRLALKEGRLTYQRDRGACKVDGSWEAYTKSGQCVECSKRQGRARAKRGYWRKYPDGKPPTARQKAQQAGKITYRGRKHRCGATERYTRSGGCVRCMKQLTRERGEQGYFRALKNGEPWRPHKGPVRGRITYLISEAGGGFVKIGSTTPRELTKRLATLQCGNPRLLVITATIAYDCEAQLHRKFAHTRARVRGDWFHPYPAILQEFKERGVTL